MMHYHFADSYLTSEPWARSLIFVFSILLLIGLCSMNVAAAQTGDSDAIDVSDPTVTLKLEKKFSGPVPDGYRADQFSFHVIGSTVDETVTLTSGKTTANATIELPIGTYTITEIGPTDFVPGEWRPGWYGQCASGTDFSTQLIIDESNVDHGTIYCQADNQWRFGTLRVKKEIVGTTTSPAQFNFLVTQADQIRHDGSFGETGEQIIVVGAGDYEVVEQAAADYEVSYSADCSGTMAFEDAKTCTITNTLIGDNGGGDSGEEVLGCTNSEAENFNPAATPDNAEADNCTFENDDGDNGGEDPGGGEPDKYKIAGYVWHDDNENALWEGFDSETGSTTSASTTEEALAGWTVSLTNGTTTKQTTTSQSGYYFFEVGAGTWTISQMLMTNWKQTAPLGGVHVAVVSSSSTSTNQYYNFGNNQSTSSGGDGGDGDGDSDGGNGGDDTSNGHGGSSRSSGGGYIRPICDRFDLIVGEDGYLLEWETRRGDQLTITENGVSIYDTDDESTITAASLSVSPAPAAVYELTVVQRGREATCSVTADMPTGSVLGEQVSPVPLGAANTGHGGVAVTSDRKPSSLFGMIGGMISSFMDYVRFGAKLF